MTTKIISSKAWKSAPAATCSRTAPRSNWWRPSATSAAAAAISAPACYRNWWTISARRIKSANRLPRFATLTTREREVLKMLAEGNSVKEIACDLNLSVKTVEAHKFNLMRKLDIHNKAQLVQYAIQKKIIKIPNLV